MERKIWFTSDPHFGHQKEFLWGPRGFGSSLEHDEAIIRNWNSVVDCDDDVYVLGDFMLGDNDYGIKCINRLTGKIHFFLCHYPVITANYDDQKAWAKHLINLHGHTHSTEKFYNNNPYMYNVGLDSHNNFPVEINKIINDIKDKKIQLDKE